jgi:hypothetical protein
MDINHNLILGCNYCEICLSKNIQLVYPDTFNQVEESDFIIVKESNDDYLVVLRDHTNLISSDLYYRITKIIKSKFHYKVKLDVDNVQSMEHYHIHISKEVKEV